MGVVTFLREVFSSSVEWVGIVLTILPFIEKIPQIREWLQERPILERFIPLLWVIGLCGVLYGFYAAWQNQYRRANELDEKIKSLTEPNFALTIDFAILGENVGGSHAILIVTINNKGAAGAAVPSSWALRVDTSTGVFYGEPSTMTDEPLDFCMEGMAGMARRFVREDGLDYRASKGIDRMNSRQGVLMFVLRGLSPDRLTQDSTSFQLSVEDVNGRSFSSRIAVAELKVKAIPVFGPDFKYPTPIRSSKCR